MTVTLSRITISRGELSLVEATPEAGSEVKGTVVMVPGFTGSREDFLPMAPFVTAAGYLTALITGIVIGTIAGTFDSVNKVITPFVSFWQGFPRLVFYPFFAVALGYSVGSRMVHVAFVIVFVIIVSTAAGVADVDIDVRHHARILGANRWQVIRDTRLPAAVMWVGTSARITFGFAIQAAIVAEFTGASSGLGYLMVRGQNSFNVNMVWAATVATIVVAVVVDQLLRLVQERFSRWQTM